MQYQTFVLAFLIIVSECRDLYSAPPLGPKAEVKSQTRSTDDADTIQGSGSSRMKDGKSGDGDRLAEFEQLMRKLEEIDKQSPQTLHISGGDAESLAKRTRYNLVNLMNLYLPSPEIANPACRADLMAILLAVLDIKNPLNSWAMYLVDSWGKLPDGMLVGNFKSYGFFHECLNIRVHQPKNASSELKSSSRLVYPKFNLHEYLHNLFYPGDGTQSCKLQNPFMLPDDRERSDSATLFEDSSYFEEWKASDQTVNFEGQYCFLGYTLNNSKTMEGLGDGLRMPGMSTTIPMNQEALLNYMAYGTCMPSTCKPSELQESVNSALSKEGMKVAYLFCQTASTHHKLGAPEIVGIVLVSVLCGLLLLATLADLATSDQRWQHCRTGPLKYLLTFSLPANITKLFHLDTRPAPHIISPVYGVRFMSILWVVLGHQFAFSVTSSQNAGELPKLTEGVLFQLIGNADKSVDTFFLMSGLLVTVGILTQVNRRGRFSPPLYYIHRLVRLLPPLALSVALVACLAGLVVSGPVAPTLEPTQLRWCRHNWWMDVTFLTNLFSPHFQQLGPDYGGTTCLPHTWYVDVDMQLFIFMPLFILPLYYNPKIGRVWLAFVTLVSLAIPAIIIYVDDLWPTNMAISDQSKSGQYMNKVYMMPWTRANSYLVGAWFGYLIYLARCDPAIARLTRWQVWAGWGTSTGTALAVLFGITKYNQMSLTEAVPIMSRTEAVFYGGLHRAAWAAAVGWVLLACHWGYGGPVNWILSHPMWQPLSRLTYTVYLTSLPVQVIIFSSTQRPTYYTIYHKIQETCGVMLVVLGVSLWVTLVSESPVLMIEKLLLTPRDQPIPSSEVRPGQTAATGQNEVNQATEQVKGEMEAKINKGECSGDEDETEVNTRSTSSKELYEGSGYQRL